MTEAEAYAKQQAELIRKQQAYQLEQAKLAEEQRIKALESTKQQSLAQTAQQKQTTEEEAKVPQQQAYLQRMKQQKDLNEQLIRAGLGTSGVSETTKADLYGNYGNNINSINASKLKALQEIGNNETNIGYQYGQDVANVQSEEAIRRAQIQSGIDELALSQYNTAYGNYVAQKQYEDKLKQQAYENAMAEKQYQDALKQQALENELSKRQLDISAYKAYSSGNDYMFDENNNLSGGMDSLGNNTETQNKSNYYFKNSTQPRYIENSELKSSGLFAKDVMNLIPELSGVVKNGQNIWTTDGKYFVWDSAQKDYINITEQLKKKQTVNKTSSINIPSPFSLIKNVFDTMSIPGKTYSNLSKNKK